MGRDGAMATAQSGCPTAGLFGYSHLTGGHAGGQAEYVGVPMADVAPMLAPEGVDDTPTILVRAAGVVGASGDFLGPTMKVRGQTV
jgi:threonine dehydrogenase-like Zn-dependent dehydrogenase